MGLGVALGSARVLAADLVVDGSLTSNACAGGTVINGGRGCRYGGELSFDVISTNAVLPSLGFRCLTIPDRYFASKPYKKASVGPSLPAGPLALATNNALSVAQNRPASSLPSGHLVV